MSSQDRPTKRAGIFLPPGEGRVYPMGRISAVFKADGDETLGQYSISEWWLEPYTQGPGTHSHAEDDIFYVIEGTMSFSHWRSLDRCPQRILRVGTRWHDT